MKVIHLLKSNSYSGAENVAIQIINYSISHGVEAYYVSAKGSIEYKLKNLNVPYYMLDEFNYFQIKELVNRVKPDIIHAHDFAASIISSTFSRQCKIISHIHNNDPKMRLWTMKSFLYFISLNKYEHLFVVSKSIVDECIYKEKIKASAEVIGNPIQVTQLIGEKSKDVCDLIFVGRFTEQKNPLFFVHIIEELSCYFENIQARMVGNGHLYKEIQDYVRKRHLEKNITLLGYKDNPLDYIASSKVMVIPSKYEGFGLVAVEAMANGLPVLCSNVGGLPSLVNDSCGKVCTSKEEFVQEIDILLSSKNYYNEKSKGAFLRAKELDNSNNYFGNILEVYGKAVK